MPKAKWGSDLTPDEIDNAKGGDFSPYAGPTPPSGVYKFVLKQAKKGVTKNEDPKLFTVWELVPREKDQKKFAGAPVFDHMPVTKATAWRAKALCAALGITSNDFMGKTVVDEDGKVLKIGSKKIDGGKIEVYINVKRDNDAEYGIRLVLNGAGYLPVVNDAADDDADSRDDDDDADDGDRPF